jgi:hypothetical protein
LKEDQDGDLYMHNKLSRVTLYVDIDSGVVINNQVYPQRCQNEMSKYCRALVEELISNKFGLPNVWTPTPIKNISIDDSYNHGYNDYYQQCGSEASVAFVLKELCAPRKVMIGNKCYYADEKVYLDDNETIFYRNSHSEYCEYCGGRCSEDEVVYIEDYGYVCDDCRHNSGSFYRCEECGCWYHEDRTDYVIVDGETFCDNCARHMDYGEDCINPDNYTTEYHSIEGEVFYTTEDCETLFTDFIMENFSTDSILELLDGALNSNLINREFHDSLYNELRGNEEEEDGVNE